MAMVSIQACIQVIRSWSRDNLLLLNDRNAEIVMFAKRYSGEV